MFKFFFMIILLPLSSYGSSLKSLNHQTQPFSLPSLSFKIDALEPAIDAKTMEVHHGKHHQGYIHNLNKALEAKTDKISLYELLANTSKHPLSVRNNAGGHWNHSFFWTLLKSPHDKSKMSNALKKAIVKQFKSVENFKEEFTSHALGLFGSGWVWLIKDKNGRLQITTTQNQDNPLMDVASTKGTPILGLDVWEHAYYLSYQNRRSEYINKFWDIVDWTQVSNYFKEK